MIDRIVSGGQTGANIGGLEAAERLNLPTGGWIPKGWRTEDGPKPELKRLGLKETRTSEYRVRTYFNVEEADGTIWFGSTTSPEYECTAAAATSMRKPFLVFSFPCGRFATPKDFRTLRNWITACNVRVLNVAGHRESKCPGIANAVSTFLCWSLA